MRRFLTCAPMILLLALLLAACGRAGGNDGEQLALDIRTRMLEAAGCQMEAEVLADYGDRVYSYTLSFQWQREGESVLKVLAPDNIKGVEAVIEKGQTVLQFDGARLETGDLDAQGLSPIDALPALLTACQEGYITNIGTEKLGEEDTVRVTYGNANQEIVDTVQYCVWYQRESGQPLTAEIVSDGRTVIRCNFHSFSIT